MVSASRPNLNSLHLAGIMCAHCNEVGFYPGGAVENERDWVLGFTQCLDRGSLRRQQGATPLNDWANSIRQGLTEFDVFLQVGCLGHSMHKYHVVRPVK